MMRTMYDPFSGNMYGFDDSVITGIITDSCYSKSEIDSKLAAVLRLCGQKDKFSDLPNTHEVGDVWIVLEDNSEYAWIKSGKWEKLGPVLDLAAYATTEYVDGLVGSVPSAYNNVVAYIAAVSEVANAALPKATYDAFLVTNTAAIAAAKKAGDDAQTTIDNYKTSNDNALAGVKTTADGAVQTTAFESFKTTNTAAIAAAKKAGDDAQTTIDNYKTANDNAVAGIKSTADGAVQNTAFESFKTTNTAAIAAAKKSGDDAQTDLNGYKTTNDQAVAAAKKAGDDAQAAIDNYKTSNNQALANVKSTADGAVQNSDFETFKSSNTTAIADAKKAGTDAAAALDTYKTSNNQALQNVKSTADGALQASAFTTFEQLNAQNIAAAAQVGANAQQSINTFAAAQLVFESTAEAIAALVDPTAKVETSDVYFSRRKTYYKLVDTEYVALVIGTDYDAMTPVADFGETVYEAQGFAVTAIVSKVNELVAAGNTLIAAHKAAAQASEPEVVE